MAEKTIANILSELATRVEAAQDALAEIEAIVLKLEEREEKNGV